MLKIVGFVGETWERPKSLPLTVKGRHGRPGRINSRWVSVVEFHDGALGIGKVFGQESTVVK